MIVECLGHLSLLCRFHRGCDTQLPAGFVDKMVDMILRLRPCPNISTSSMVDDHLQVIAAVGADGRHLRCCTRPPLLFFRGHICLICLSHIVMPTSIGGDVVLRTAWVFEKHRRNFREQVAASAGGMCGIIQLKIFSKSGGSFAYNIAARYELAAIPRDNHVRVASFGSTHLVSGGMPWCSSSYAATHERQG